MRFFLLFLASLLFAQNPDFQRLQSISNLLSPQEEERDRSFEAVKKNFQISDIPMLLEFISISPYPSKSREIFSLLAQNTERAYSEDLNEWYQWLWKQSYEENPYYAQFKSFLYALIDPKFKSYFSTQYQHSVRLDEIRWGGVKQDGIPPLHKAKLLNVDEATYLDDDDIVFGMLLNGEARAYPKRILAWHELLRDTIAGIDITAVFCSLCGTMLVYESTYKGVHYKLGTSGFLYRSNKLMYDKETSSLWNSFYGEPVLGRLVGKGIKLKRHAVVQTSWKEWKTKHPETKVLSLETGYKRDYGEGVAYRRYFATDRLMFAVPNLDDRLNNKDEVIGVLLDAERNALAFSTEFLEEHPIYNFESLLLLTDESGATRVYESAQILFKSRRRNELLDEDGRVWRIKEDEISSKNQSLKRIVSHRAFWFGWHAAYPKTKLIYR